MDETTSNRTSSSSPTSLAGAALPPGFRPSCVLVHYDEIALKGKNRKRFESALARSVRRALEDAGARNVRPIFGRLLVELAPDSNPEVVRKRLRRVFGVSRYAPAERLPQDFDKLTGRVLELVSDLAPRSFAVVTHRVNKELPFTSTDANRRLGAAIKERTGWPVRLDAPELPVHAYWIGKHVFLAFERLEGPGGLPWASTGRVACLVSGGIDSPVAAHRIMRRGAEAVFIHFHSAPQTSPLSQDKVREITELLLPHGHAAPLYMVPFAELQHRIVSSCPPPLRVLLYRRFMMRAAQAIACKERALALVTGESLGQVASQTLENLHAIESPLELPVLRPLVGMSKQEIVADARALGTYETSIEPHDDCCSYLMPRNPATRSTPEELDAAEEVFDVAAEVERLVGAASREEMRGA